MNTTIHPNVVRAESNGFYYLREDTQILNLLEDSSHPQSFIIPKEGAIPVCKHTGKPVDLAEKTLQDRIDQALLPIIADHEVIMQNDDNARRVYLGFKNGRISSTFVVGFLLAVLQKKDAENFASDPWEE